MLEICHSSVIFHLLQRDGDVEAAMAYAGVIGEVAENLR
jgi:hypothetical protein